jgi:hypothetical protein
MENCVFSKEKQLSFVSRYGPDQHDEIWHLFTLMSKHFETKKTLKIYFEKFVPRS